MLTGNIRPVERLLAATRYVRERLHYRVGPGPSFGVRPADLSEPGAWVKDPRVLHVSPLGAAILHRQPKTTDLMEAARMAIGCESAISVLGLIDGIAHQPPRSSSLKRRATPEEQDETTVYVHALECGFRLRAGELTTLCPDHKVRHLQVADCPLCKVARGQS